METKFQTSFIPKKQTAPIIGGGSSIGMNKPVRNYANNSVFMSIAVVIFLISLAALGGSYAYKSILLTQQENYKKELVSRQKQFNLDLIEELKKQNIKIDLANQLLNGHLAVSQIFDILGRLTIESVRFLNLNVTAPQNSGDDLKISLSGYGNSLQSVAFQSDVLGQLEQYGLRKVVKNPILSDPTLGDNGKVSFGFVASIDPTNMSYEKSITGNIDTTGNASSTNSNQ